MNIRMKGLGLTLILLPLASFSQVPVDDDGNAIGDYGDEYEQYSTDDRATGNEGIPLLTTAELEELIGPIALYPDDLLAVVLPASTFPLQVVQAARFLEDLETDPGLEPDSNWDDSIIALINYPEVVELLNEDLDWTWRLGEAVVAQQEDVVSAVEDFRNRAYAAGNLQSDSYQTITEDDGIIEITPVNEEVIYVPYYEPEHVVVYQPRQVYYYYPDPCPVYYYPYPSSYNFHNGFNRGYFWGLTTAYTIGWHSNYLRVYHHSYRGHPYYGRRYWNRLWYRRPSISVHNNVYIRNGNNYNRHSTGDVWRSNRNRRLRYTDQRITASTDYAAGQRSTRQRDSGRQDGTVNRQRNTTERDRGVTREPGASTRNRQNQRQDGRVGGNSETRQRQQTTRNNNRGETDRSGGTGLNLRNRENLDRNADRQPNQNRSNNERQRQSTERRGDAPTYTRQEPRAAQRQRTPAGASSGSNQQRSSNNANRQRSESSNRSPNRQSSGNGNRQRSESSNRSSNRQSAGTAQPRPSNNNRQQSGNSNRTPDRSSNQQSSGNSQRSESRAPARDDTRRRRR